MLRLEPRDVVGQVLALEPRYEPADMSGVLGHRVRRPTVGLELDENAGKGVDAAHGLKIGLGRQGRSLRAAQHRNG